MPSSQRSLNLTETYRRRMVGLRDRVQQITEDRWREVDFDDLDGSFDRFLSPVAKATARAQQQAVRLSNAYLSAFVASELNHPVRTPFFDSGPYVGVARNGQPLDDALRSSLIAVKVALIGPPIPSEEALKAGLERARRTTGLATDTAARESLTDAMATNPRIAGWKRAVRGTCGACLGMAEDALSPPGTPLEIHPGCQCVSEPVVKSVRDRFPRPSGPQIFAAMSATQQDDVLGAGAAEQVRAGDTSLRDLVDHSPLETEKSFITQKPAESL